MVNWLVWRGEEGYAFVIKYSTLERKGGFSLRFFYAKLEGGG